MPPSSKRTRCVRRTWRGSLTGRPLSRGLGRSFGDSSLPASADHEVVSTVLSPIASSCCSTRRAKPGYAHAHEESRRHRRHQRHRARHLSGSSPNAETTSSFSGISTNSRTGAARGTPRSAPDAAAEPRRRGPAAVSSSRTLRGRARRRRGGARRPRHRRRHRRRLRHAGPLEADPSSRAGSSSWISPTPCCSARTRGDACSPAAAARSVCSARSRANAAASRSCFTARRRRASRPTSRASTTSTARRASHGLREARLREDGHDRRPTPPPFAGEPDAGGAGDRAIDRRSPDGLRAWIWRWIMFAIRLLPRFVMRKIGF